MKVKRNAFSPWHIAPEIRIKWMRWSHVKTGRNVEHQFNYFIKRSCYRYHLRIKCERCLLRIIAFQVMLWWHSPCFRRLTVHMYTNNPYDDVCFVNHYSDVIWTYVYYICCICYPWNDNDNEWMTMKETLLPSNINLTYRRIRKYKYRE